MGSCVSKLQNGSYVNTNKLNHVNINKQKCAKNTLSGTRLKLNKSGDDIKKRILKCPIKQMGDTIFSQTKSQRKEIWNKIDGLKGAHLLSFHFYRRIYDNNNKSKQKNIKIKQFCQLFMNRPFAQAVDRLTRFMSCQLDGENNFWNVDWIKCVHCTHMNANVIMSPLFGQMWYSFMCRALIDLEWSEEIKQEIRIFFKNCMIFLFMDTWPACKYTLTDKPIEGLLNEGKERVTFWGNQYRLTQQNCHSLELGFGLLGFKRSTMQ